MVVFHRATIEFASRTGNGPPVVVANYRDVKPPLPEEKLFHSVFRAALTYKVVSGLGKLSLLWATVVILGGFITLIKPLDFWIVTAIVFIEAIRIFSTAEDPEEQIFIRAPEVMKGIQRTTSKCSYPFFFASVFPVALTLAQLAAVSTSIALSLWRLIKQEYVDHRKKCDKDSCKDEQENIRMSLNIFYVLVVVQAIIFFSNLTSPMVKQMYMVCDKYNLEHGQGLELLTRYILDNHIKCVTGNVRGALNNDLVTYAKELLISDATDDQHLGVWTIDRILRNHANNRYFLMKLRAFGHDAIGRIVSLLGSSHRTETPGLASREDMKARAAAARVLLELAPSLLLESFPGMLQLVSLLLTERRIVHIDSPGDNDSRRQGHDVNFTWYGVKILEKLVDNPDNCWHVVHTANCLVPNIIDLITNYANKEIVQTSVTVLRKLSGSAGDVGDALRCSISKNIHILSSITSILEDRTGGQPSALQADAADILSCLALDQACKQDMCISRRVIRALATILVVNAAAVAEIPEEDSRSDRARVAKCAAEALVLLTTRSNSQSCNTASILLEIVPECIQQFVGIISHEEAEHKYLITKLLSNLRAYSNADQYAHHLKKIDNALPEILKAINLGLEKLLVPEHPSGDYTVTSKLLDSFAGLAVQICTCTRAAHQHFAGALKSADLEAGAFVHKLKEMLVLHKSPTTEFPGIRRTTVQLIIWMMRNTSNGYTRHFMQCGMDEALREVADTETMLERFELFHYGVGVCKHTEPISSLINIARTGM